MYFIGPNMGNVTVVALNITEKKSHLQVFQSVFHNQKRKQQIPLEQACEQKPRADPDSVLTGCREKDI